MYKLTKKSLKQSNRYKLSGELTVYSAQSIYSELDIEEIRGKDLLLDLSKVSEIDTAGAQLIVMLTKEVAVNDKVLKLEKMSTVVEEFIQLFNLNKYLCGVNADE